MSTTMTTIVVAWASTPLDETVGKDASPRDDKPIIPFKEVGLRLSKVFACYDEDEDEDISRTTCSDCYSDEEKDCSNDESDNSSFSTPLGHKPLIPFKEVGLRLSKIFASYDEDEDEEINCATGSVRSGKEEDFSEVARRLSKVFASHYEDDDEDVTCAAMPGSGSAKEEDFSEVARRLSKVFASHYEDEDEDVHFTKSSFSVPSDHEAVIPFQEVALRLSKVFACYDEDTDEEIDCTTSSDIHSDEEKDCSCDESDGSSLCGWDNMLYPRVEARGLGKPWKVSRAASLDGSTSTGTISDSDGESSCDSFPVLGN